MRYRVPFDVNVKNLNFFDLDNLIEEHNITIEPQTEYDVLRPGAFFAYGKSVDVVAFVLAVTGDRENERIEFLAHLESYPAYKEVQQSEWTQVV